MISFAGFISAISVFHFLVVGSGCDDHTRYKVVVGRHEFPCVVLVADNNYLGKHGFISYTSVECYITIIQTLSWTTVVRVRALDLSVTRDLTGNLLLASW